MQGVRAPNGTRCTPHTKRRHRLQTRAQSSGAWRKAVDARAGAGGCAVLLPGARCGPCGGGAGYGMRCGGHGASATGPRHCEAMGEGQRLRTADGTLGMGSPQFDPTAHGVVWGPCARDWCSPPPLPCQARPTAAAAAPREPQRDVPKALGAMPLTVNARGNMFWGRGWA